MDVLDDEEARNSKFFTKAESCLVISKPQTLLRVRNQGATFTCTSHVATATMFGEEVKRRQRSQQGSTQELLDYLPLYVLPEETKEDGSSSQRKKEREIKPVLPDGCQSSYKLVFNYIKNFGVSLVEDYPWNGVCKSCTSGEEDENVEYERRLIDKDWDGKVEYEGRSIEKEQKIFIEGYERINRHDRLEIEKHLRERPITGCVILTDKLKNWTGESMFRGEGVKVAEEGRHAVTIVGYGDEGGIHMGLIGVTRGILR